MSSFPWGAILDWLQSNWLGLLTLFVVAFGAITSWRLLRRSKRDITPNVYFVDENGTFKNRIEVQQEGERAEPFSVHLAVVNLGGSKLKNGKLTITLPSGLEVIDADEWEEDTPNALVQDGSGIAHHLPTMGRNDREDLPSLSLHDSDLRREGGSHTRPYRLRWEVWSGREGLGSDDLKIRFTIDASA